MTDKRRALGRGLDALLPAAQAPQKVTAAYGDKSVFSCAIDKLVPQRGQPRRHFDTEKLDELAASIREHGLIEPLAVRRAPGALGLEGVFEIIAGERRFRASQRAGLLEVLVVVKDVSPKAAFELAIIENVQREDLNPVELAEALDRLVKEHGYTQESLGERLGKNRTTITNSLRLLRLPADVREKIVQGELSEGHGRALLGAEDPKELGELAQKVLRGRLSVRATEALVRSARDKREAQKNKAKGATPAEKTASVRDLEARLSRTLGARVLVRDQGNKGEVVIPYADLDALDRLLEKLGAG
ncbi:MAG TPA: ParB/RepB/Spo0J family partition protein [Polyangiaceae bacterium]|nr:ParB/RepB/Spo0J family partition protein [Polyangiaceae bacterium]